jgi:hypothetical protein
MCGERRLKRWSVANHSGLVVSVLPPITCHLSLSGLWPSLSIPYRRSPLFPVSSVAQAPRRRQSDSQAVRQSLAAHTVGHCPDVQKEEPFDHHSRCRWVGPFGGPWTLDPGPWSDSGPWTLHPGPWTLGPKLPLMNVMKHLQAFIPCVLVQLCCLQSLDLARFWPSVPVLRGPEGRGTEGSKGWLVGGHGAILSEPPSEKLGPRAANGSYHLAQSF